MQSFLPYSDFTRSAKVLDRQRLGKQRVENLQILGTILDPSKGWQNHPAVNMWRGHEGYLVRYNSAICDEWIDRGYKDTCKDKVFNLWCDSGMPNIVLPLWLGKKRFHQSHRSRLIQKFPDHYGPLFPNTPVDLPYYWPNKKVTS